MKILPVNLDDLIHAQAVESERIEFKKAWDEYIKDAVIRDICAFANDLHNINGGYLIIGIDAPEGRPILPPQGLDELQMETIQKEIRGNCNRIDPLYMPIISPEIFMGKSILILWAPAGEVRPYQAPESCTKGAERHYYVRLGGETVKAKSDILNQLMSLTAKVPFDDRRRDDAALGDISASIVRKFLADTRSGLVVPGTEIPSEDLLRYMRCTVRINGAEVPRNVALMFFSENPEKFFPGTRIEVAHFGDEAGGNLIEEQTFRGPLPQILKQALDYLEGLCTSVIRKVPLQAEVQKFVAFPFEAMEEALVNTVLHRGYDEPPEPIKVYLFPDRMEITSYPGPVPGLEIRHLSAGAQSRPLPQRNRRIGEFLKELRLAEMRNTGIPKIHRKMRENGSPPPRFEFDEKRTYFSVTLPAHPRYVVLHALRESALLWATGEKDRALTRLEEAGRASPGSGILCAQAIEYAAAAGDLVKAGQILSEFEQEKGAEDRHLAYAALAKAYLDNQRHSDARDLLENLPKPVSPAETVDRAILHKRAGDLEKTHQLFESVHAQIQNDPRALLEFAQTKIGLATSMRPRKRQESDARKRLDRQAEEMLRRVIQLADWPMREAWAWSELARIMPFLGAPNSEIEDAYKKAIQIAPEEPRFKAWYDTWKSRFGKARGKNQRR